MPSFRIELGNGDTALIHGVESNDSAWDELIRRQPDFVDEDYDIFEVNPDMGESQTLQYDHVYYA